MSTQLTEAAPDVGAWKYAMRYVRRLQLRTYCGPDHPVVLVENSLIAEALRELEEMAGSDESARASARASAVGYMDMRIAELDVDEDIRSGYVREARLWLVDFLPVRH